MLVIQNDVGNRLSPTTVVAHVSATPRRDYPFLAALEASELGKASWVHCETITTLPVAMLEARFGELSRAAMRRVDDALRSSLALG